jgi:hypothetical protein
MINLWKLAKICLSHPMILKGHSHQIRSVWKWYGWIVPHGDIRRCLDVTSTHVSTTYNYDPNIATSEDITQKCSDHMTLRPKSGRIICPHKIVTPWPPKSGLWCHSCTLHAICIFGPNCLWHCIPDSTVLPLHFSTDFRLLALFLHCSHCYKDLLCNLNWLFGYF